MKTLGIGLLLAVSATSQVSNTSFQELFDSSVPTSQWTIRSSTASTLHWWNPSDPPAQYGQVAGLYGRNDAGSALAYAPWQMGNSPFNFQFDAYPVSVWQKAAAGGVIVALTTALPGSMGSTDSSIVFGFWPSGPMVDMRSGELATLFSVPNAFTKLSLSREWRWMAGMAGGTGGAHNESFSWPQASNGGSIPYWRWTFQVTRDGSNNLTWNVFTDQYKNGSVPYYTYTMAIPSSHTSDNFQYVSVLPVAPQTLTPYQAAVKVTNMRGWAGVSGGDVPTISSIVPANGSTTFESGQTILIQGTNFTSGSPYTLRIGQGSTLQTVAPSFISSTTLSAVLPAEPDGSTYRMHLMRNGIDAEYYPGIAYSPPVVYAIDPFEVPVNPVSTADGTVQFYGAGFDPTSTVTIGGSPAAVTYISPLQLSVTVPPGTAGFPAIVVTCANGNTIAYNSAVPATYPPTGRLSFGYAPHPYLQFNSSTLPDLQSRWTNPAFANYVYPISQSITGGNGSGPGGAPDFWDYGYAIALSGDTSTYPAYQALLASDSLGQNLAGLPGLPVGELNRLQFTVPYAAWSMYLYNYASQIAQFYDQFFPVMAPSERSAYLTYLRNALGYYYYVEHANDNQVTGSAGWPNRVAIANAGAGVVALSLINSLQSVRGYTLDSSWVATTGGIEATNAVNRLKKWFSIAWTADGGYAEGPLYAGYGTTAALIFTHALENTNAMLGVSPADGGLISGGNYFSNFQNWVNSLWDGTQWSTFDDSQPQAYMLGMLVDADNRFGLPNLTYLADYLKSAIVSGSGIYRNTVPGASSAGGDNPAYALMWRSSAFPSSFTGFPTLQVNDSVQQAALRSDSGIATAFYIGVKGSSNRELATNLHHQNDTASFVVQSRGELFLIDPGYYLPGPLNHSLLSIDGAVPGLANANVGVMDTSANLNTTAFRSATIDATHAYAGVSSVRRVFTMYSNGTSQLGIILDDVQTSGVGSIVSYYQSGQSTSLNGMNGFTLTGNFSKLIGTFDGPSMSITSGPGTPSFHVGTTANSWVYDALSCQLPQDPWCATTSQPLLQKYTTIQAAYTASGASPFLTLLTPAGLDGSGALTATVDRSTPGVINVNISDGSSIGFSQQSGSWRVSATNPSQ